MTNEEQGLYSAWFLIAAESFAFYESVRFKRLNKIKRKLQHILKINFLTL